jgi:hypothetical protein
VTGPGIIPDLFLLRDRIICIGIKNARCAIAETRTANIVGKNTICWEKIPNARRLKIKWLQRVLRQPTEMVPQLMPQTVITRRTTNGYRFISEKRVAGCPKEFTKSTLAALK